MRGRHQEGRREAQDRDDWRSVEEMHTQRWTAEGRRRSTYSFKFGFRI